MSHTDFSQGTQILTLSPNFYEKVFEKVLTPTLNKTSKSGSISDRKISPEMSREFFYAGWDHQSQSKIYQEIAERKYSKLLGERDITGEFPRLEPNRKSLSYPAPKGG